MSKAECYRVGYWKVTEWVYMIIKMQNKILSFTSVCDAKNKFSF